MRFYALAATLVLAAGLCACSKTSSDQSGSTATSAPDATATTADAGAATAAPAATTEAKSDGSVANGDVYPGATLQTSGSSSAGAMGGSASGKVYTTTDSYDKVTAWYKAHMPSDAQETHSSAAGTSSTVYVTGLGTDHQESLSITTSPSTPGKVTIAVADIKK